MGKKNINEIMKSLYIDKIIQILLKLPLIKTFKNVDFAKQFAVTKIRDQRCAAT